MLSKITFLMQGIFTIRVKVKTLHLENITVYFVLNNVKQKQY